MSFLDPRIGWPYSCGVRRYCKCEKNWDGPGCTECAEGYIKETDNSCVVRTGSQMLIRKNALKMNDEQWATSWRVVNESKVTYSDYLVYTGNGTTTTDRNPRLVGNFSFVDNVTVYNVFAWMHYYATKGNYKVIEYTGNEAANLNQTNGKRFASVAETKDRISSPCATPLTRIRTI